jgi:Tol biopolymer transport system component
MKNERWTVVDRLLGAALERAPRERAAFLAEACGNDEELRREVESLLAHEKDGELLNHPAVELVGAVPTPGRQPLPAGREMGGYRIVALLGSGGMGDVYRARDTRLKRDVALKMLPTAFINDPERLARFEREARLLASLNHPNIGAIYGLEETDGKRGLVLELVEGETLADRIAGSGGRGLPVHEAMTVARQIADALDTAHEKGIVHRDLKPANVKITPGGIVKVLDFGLAKAMIDDSSPDLSQSPTADFAGTRAGIILGTPAYMSPEQARGKAIDKRTDIWAFGCLLYEMLTGRPAFGGETLSDTIAAILEREPDWTRLPTATPATVRALLLRCLEKDPRRRLRDIGDTRVVQIDERAADRAAEVPRAASRISTWAALALGIVVGATAVSLLVRRRPPAASIESPTRLTFTLPDEAPIMTSAPVASPDGRHIAFAARNADGEPSLWIRSLDSSTPRQIAGTGGAVIPFWSPDGRSVGFGVPVEGRLKVLDLTAGHVQPIGNIRDAVPGATWSKDGVVLFSPDNRVMLHRVSASGGTSEPVTTLDPARRENSHRWPHFLPDGRHFLFTARSDVRENTGIYVGTLGSNERTWLMEAQSNAVYTAPGYLLFVREGALLARRFDAATLRLSGEPFALAGNVAQSTVGAFGSFSVSSDGRVIAYRTAEATVNEIMWFDRVGAKIGETIARGEFEAVRLASDGQQAVVTMPDKDSGNRDIWQLDLSSGTPTRLTSHPANDWNAVWSPDGKELAFGSDRNGLSAVYRKATDGSGREVALSMTGVPGNRFPDDWSEDGQLLAVHSSMPDTALDLWVVPIDGRPAYEVARTKFQEQSLRFSPDGRWIAYVSDVSGRPEIYVQALGKTDKRRVSTAGGIAPRWRRDGGELFFVDAANRLMAVAIKDGKPVGSTRALFNTCGPSGTAHLRYDVVADGARSLWLCPSARPTASLVTVSIQPAQLEARESR